MRRGRGFSMIITRRTLIAVLIILAAASGAVFGPKAVVKWKRAVHGVKPGVTLDGYSVAGLLEEELYDVLASLAEGYYVEAHNASWDWNSGMVLEEQVGQVVDIKSTVEALLSAPANTNTSYVMVPILPSITANHFKPYYRGPDTEPAMALMINVDWGDEYIEPMLDVLNRFEVTATWFPTGRWVERTPGLAKKIADAGHELGNHGGWHGMASQMGREEVTRLIQQGEDLIVESVGQKPRVFAPPAGDFNHQTVAVAGELGYKTVLWTIDTVDWQRPAPTVIIDRVIGKATNGALVLMHPTQPTLEALPVIIDQLLRKGFRLVTVSELLAD